MIRVSVLASSLFSHRLGKRGGGGGGGGEGRKRKPLGFNPLRPLRRTLAHVEASSWSVWPMFPHCCIAHSNTAVRGDAWCNGERVCFPSLPPVLLGGFKSRLGLESSGFSMWHFLKLVARGFLRVLRFPSPSSV